MEIGTIGAGALARAFANRALKAGHKVKLSNDRGPDSLREIVDQLGPGAVAVPKEAAASCEMVLLAVPWVQPLLPDRADRLFPAGCLGLGHC